MIDFHPRVLVAPNYYRRLICIQEKDRRIGRRFREEMVLNGEIQIRVSRSGKVDLGLCFWDFMQDGEKPVPGEC